MTKPLFTITFTPEQAVDFIKQKIKDNYSSLDDFDVVIQQKPISEVKLENPWLIPDADGWFTHDHDYLFETAPDYVNRNKEILVVFHDGYVSKCPGKVLDYDWRQTGQESRDIAKWKYID